MKTIYYFNRQITECVQHFENAGFKEHLLLSLNNPHILRHCSFNENKKSKGEKNKEKYRRISSRELELKLDVNSTNIFRSKMKNK